jgi:hypothetical protein
VLDVIDFSYRPSPPLSAGTHTYRIEVRDTLGNLVTDTGSFLVPSYPTLTPEHQAVSVNTNRSGFYWHVFMSDEFNTQSLASAEIALACQLLDPFGGPAANIADPDARGVALAAGVTTNCLVRFEIPTVINLSQTGGEMNGSFSPDGQMPGVPSLFSHSDGIDAEILTFVRLPAGLITMGVISDDGFRTQAGYINSPTTGLVLGQSETPATTLFQFVVQFPGIYPFRTIWQDDTGAAHVEWFTVKADGTRVLLNDTENGGFQAFCIGVAPNEVRLSLNIRLNGGQRTVTWSEPGVVLQESTNLIDWTDLNAATSPYISAPGGRTAVFFRLKKNN